MVRKLSGLLLILLLLSTGSAQPRSYGFYTFDPISNEPYPILRNNLPVPTGNLVQMISTGPNQMIDLPDPSSPDAIGGDDTLKTRFEIGSAVDIAGTFAVTLTSYGNPIEGNTIYFRVWCNDSLTVPSSPIPMGSFWAVTSIYVIPNHDSDFWHVQVMPSSADPVWQLYPSTNATSEQLSTLPNRITLFVSPNPFNAATTFRFAIQSAGVVRMEIVNTIGQCIFTYPDRYFPVGEHIEHWNARMFPSGSYYLRCISFGEYSIRKLVLLK